MRADRLLSILLMLQTHGQLTAKKLAKRLEVSERTIARDMEALGFAGVPVVAGRGSGGGWRLMEGYRTALTALSEAEVQALFVSQPARLLADLRLEKASSAASVKLLSLLPSVYRKNAELARQRIHVDISGWNRSSESVPLLPALQDAVWRDRKLGILYDRGDDCEPAERLVDPLGLVAKGAVWYLVARIDGDVRTYRVSRIRSVTPLDESFVRPEDFDLAKYWESSSATFRERMPRFSVVIRAENAVVKFVHAFIRFGGVDRVEPDQREGWSRMALHFDAEEVAVHALLGFGTSVEVIEPESVSRKIRETAQAIVNR